MASEGELQNKVRAILFETTWRCNATCAFCYNHWTQEGSAPPKKELSTRKTKRILKKVIRASGCSQVSLTGGESTLRDDIFDLIACVRLQGATVSLLTNGRRLDRSFARDLRRVGCGLVQLTFCGLDASSHDALCGLGAFEHLQGALSALEAEKVAVGLTFVLTKQNIDQARLFPKFAKAHGVEMYLLNRFNPGGRGTKGSEHPPLLPSLAELRDTLEGVDQSLAESKTRAFAAVPIMPCLVSPQSYPRITFAAGCAAGTRNSYFTVDPWGRLRFCNHTSTVLGDLWKQSFWDITGSAELERFRSTKPPFCQACPGWEVCRGGCRAASEQAFGRWDVEDPLLKACLDSGEIVPPK